MRNSKALAFILVTLVVAALACGSSTDVEVNPPSDQGSQATAVQSDPTSAPLGTTRSNPAPTGSEVVVDDMGFVVTGSTRPATEIIMTGNQFNTEPEAGQEYVLINVAITCKLTADEKCSFSSYNLKLLGSSGIERETEIMIAGVDGLLESFGTEFYGGATVTGSIPFIVNSDETNLILIYSPLFGGEFYLAIQ